MYQQRPPITSYNGPRRTQHFESDIPYRDQQHRRPRYGHHHNNHKTSPMISRNEENWCETCDRGFRTPDLLESHKQQHQVCKIDGCQFIAHPKIITMHIQMQHSSGLFKKIGNLTNPEDIQKWREERKKKYPTKENVDKKAAELREKIERGEKMGLKRNKKMKDDIQKKRKRSSNETVTHRGKKPATAHMKSKKTKKIRNLENLPHPENIRKLKPFAGILDLATDNDKIVIEEDQLCNYEIEDEDEDCKQEMKMENTFSVNGKPKTNVCGALSSLMCEYGSSDEEVDIVVNKVQSVTEKCDDSHITDIYKDNQLKNNLGQNLCDKEGEKCNDSTSVTESGNMARNFESDDDCPPEEIKVEKTVTNETDSNKIGLDKIKDKVGNHKNIKVKRLVKTQNIKLPSTLLQKLLHREIEQERNIVLQCIRHIVKNNYFSK